MGKVKAVLRKLRNLQKTLAYKGCIVMGPLYKTPSLG